LTRLDAISQHFSVADEVELIIERGAWDSEVLYKINDSMSYLRDNSSFVSSPDTMETLENLRDRARQIGLDHFERLLRVNILKIDLGDYGFFEIIRKFSKENAEESKSVLKCLLDTGDQRALKTYGNIRGRAMIAALHSLYRKSERDKFLAIPSPYLGSEAYPFTMMVGIFIKLLQGEVKLFQQLVPQNDLGADAFEIACETSVIEICQCGVRTSELLRASQSWTTGVEGEAFIVALDTFAFFCSQFDELVANVDPLNRRKNLPQMLKNLKTHLQDIACMSLITVLMDINQSTCEMPESATVAVLTSNTARAVKRLAMFERCYANFVDEYRQSSSRAASFKVEKQNNQQGGASGSVGSRQSASLKNTEVLGSEDVTMFVTQHRQLSDRVFATVGQSDGPNIYIIALLQELTKFIQKKRTEYVKGNKAAAEKSSTILQAAAKSKSLLFSINNNLYICKNMTEYVQSCRDQEAVDLAALRTMIAALSKQCEKEIEEFILIGWSDIVQHAAPIEAKTLQYSALGGKITFESGRILKQRFESFNKDFEDFLAACNTLSIPDTEIRDQIRDKIIKFFVPKWKEFFDVYSIIQFSKKHQEQYTRLSPQLIESKIRELFL
jgi:hypothetical protein